MCPTCSPVGESHAAEAPSAQKLSDSKTEMVSLDRLLLSQRLSDHLQLENERLSAQLQEVVEMNVRWQRHDRRREAYVLRFHEANKELLQKISSLQKTISALQQQQQHNIGVSTEPSGPAEAGGASPALCALDGQLARKVKELATLGDTVEQLQEENRALQRAAAKRQEEEDERLALYKEQLEVFVEDFRKERSDRETIHGERIRLRKQLDNAEATISRLRQETADLIEENAWLRDRPTRLTHHHSDRMTEAGPERPPRQVNYVQYGLRPRTGDGLAALQTTRRPAGGHGDDVPDYDDDDLLTVDGQPQCPGSGRHSHRLAEEAGGPPPSPVMTSGPGEEEEEEAGDWVFAGPASADKRSDLPMRCPQCLAKFLVEDHGELLRHIQSCSESR